MLYGKHFASMYEGSMVGAGSHVFAVWGYVIANMVPDKTSGAQVRLNADTLSAKIGDSKERMQAAIDFLCSPDPNTTTPGNQGRRLIKLSNFDFQVVNGAHYMSIRNAEDKREKDRIRQAEYRAGKRKPKIPKSQDGPVSAKYLAQEAAYVKAHGDGDEELADKIAAGEA